MDRTPSSEGLGHSCNEGRFRALKLAVGLLVLSLAGLDAAPVDTNSCNNINPNHTVSWGMYVGLQATALYAAQTFTGTAEEGSASTDAAVVDSTSHLTNSICDLFFSYKLLLGGASNTALKEMLGVTLRSSCHWIQMQRKEAAQADSTPPNQASNATSALAPDSNSSNSSGGNNTSSPPLTNTTSPLPPQSSAPALYTICTCSTQDLQELEQYCLRRRLVVLTNRAFNAARSHCELTGCAFPADHCPWAAMAIQDETLAESIRPEIRCYDR